MSNRDRHLQAEGEHERAVQRLYAAVEQQSRVRTERDGAKDAPDAVKADASLRAADDEVSARERWLKAVDDQDY
jgi:nicotinate-nucleotide pyrophosphorylase